MRNRGDAERNKKTETNINIGLVDNFQGYFTERFL